MRPYTTASNQVVTNTAATGRQHQKRCAQCKSVFWSLRSDRLYCSKSCRQKHARMAKQRSAGNRAKGQKSQPAKRVCECIQCHEPFVTRSASSLYCSQACRQAAYRQRREALIGLLVEQATKQGYEGDKVRAQIGTWGISQLNRAKARATA